MIFTARVKTWLIYTLLLLFFIVEHESYAYQKPEKIKINARKLDKLNLSQIAEEVTKIVLELPPEGLHGFQSIIFNDKFIFVSVGEKGPNSFINHLLQFDRAGKFMRIIGEKATSKIGVTYNPKTQGFTKYDGKRLHFYNKSGDLQSSANSTISNFTYFENELWSVNLEHIDQQWLYHLMRSDLSGQNLIKTHTKKDPYHLLVGTHIRPFTSDNHLYISYNFENIIRVIEQNEPKPAFEFKISPSHENAFKSSSPAPFMVGNWIFFSYIPVRGYNVLLYNRLTKKQYNLNYRFNSRGELISGISDDIYNTGFIRMRPSNLKDHFSYVAQEDEQLVVYLVKIKP